MRAMIRSRSSGLLLGLILGCTDPTIPLGPTEHAGNENPANPPVEPVDGPQGIYIAARDGSNPTLLVVGERPAWSPDGRRIAFHRDGLIHVIGADGGGETVLRAGRDPAWAPDGTRLAFTSSEGIAVMNDDGTAARTLILHDFRDDTSAEWDQGVGKPAWSPDGSRIVFEHLGDGDMTPAQLFVMNADGTEPRRVTSTHGVQYAESDPAWSPDGAAIVFWSYGYGIASAASTGGPPRTIHRNPVVAYGATPAWSPDGRTVLFTAGEFTPEGPAIWSVAAGGGDVRIVVPGGAHPAWAPNGERLAFEF